MAELPIAGPGYIPGPTALKALTHPLRLQLLDALTVRGRATASQLAEDLGETSGATSYHLRQLARHGFIEELPEMGTTRERWWKPITGGWTMRMDEERPGHATELVASTLLETSHRRALRFVADLDRWSPQWQLAAIRQQAHLELNPAQLTALQREIEAVVDRYRDLPAGPETRRVRTEFSAFPLGEPDGDPDAG